MQIVDSFQNRLKYAMNLRNMKQVDLVQKTKIDKTLINKYISGVTNASQTKLTVLADALNVNEIWLMGYDVPMEKDLSSKKSNDFRMASYNGVDTEGLDEQDIEEINRFVEFLKQKKNKDK